ncbi:MAG: thiol reductant ABC exporter subunit CydD [Stygiobacter sp.]|jgi:ATP-binding cassette subfamily C protein CydD
MLFDRRLFSLIKSDKIQFYSALICGLLASAFTISQAYFLSRIINNVFLLGHTLERVKNILFLFAAASLLKAAFIFLQNIFSSKLVVEIKKNLRENIITNISSLGPIKIKSERTGEIVNTLLNGVDKLEDYFSKFLPQLFLAALIPLMILFFVLPKDLLSAIIFIVTAPIIPTFMFLIGSIAEKLNQKQWTTLSRMSTYFFDVLQGIPTLKLFNRTKETLKRIEDVTNIFRIKTLKVLRVAFLSALVLEVASTISVAVIAVAIGLRLLNGDFNFADALFILIIAPEFYLPLRQLGVSYHAGMEGVAAFERISLLIQTKNENQKTISSEHELKANQSIVFDNVSFTYEDRNEPAINSVSLVIEKGKVTALVGQTGSGKTTLMNMLLGFIKPQSGKIKYGNVDLSKIELNEFRKKISWLPQNPHLFNSTLLENIKLSKEDATYDDAVSATMKAKIHNLISNLPNGYESKVSEAGSNFSGGEIQRIALARAYLRNAEIICVDEPTANLDPETEKEIMNNMYELYQEKTVLIIAHRLKTIEKADKIIVMKDGKILDEGKHDELMMKSDYYKKLINEIEKDMSS